jgi:hypothetical protein
MRNLLFVFIFTITCVLSLPGQTKNTSGDPSQISDWSIRKAFYSALVNSVKAQGNRDWAALYEFQWPTALNHESLEEFAKSQENRSWNLLEFRVLRIDSETTPKTGGGSGSWTVLGCSRIRDNGKTREMQASIPVYLVEGIWYTGEVGVLVAPERNDYATSCRLRNGAAPEMLLERSELPPI